MEYKPPFEVKPPKYRYICCSMEKEEEWSCVRCEDKDVCYSSIPSFRTHKSRVLTVPNDIPQYLDKLILMNKLSTSKIEMKK